MTWPLIERELRVAWRKRKVRQFRLWASVFCVGLTCLFLLIGAIDGARGWGQGLRVLLFLTGVFVVLKVPEYTVGIFAEERRNDTLGLLFLCGIDAVELFICKTLGAALVALSCLFVLYPFLAISFLSGGYSMNSFLATVWSLPAALLFAFATSVLASVLCREESTAMFLATFIGVIICLIPFGLQKAGIGFGSLNTYPNGWLSLSPAGFLYIACVEPLVSSREIWTGCLVQLGFATLFLSLAGYVLNRVWQDRPVTAGPESWRARLRRVFHGATTWRRQLASRWLDRNPYVWLASRDRWLLSLGWMVVTGVLVLWLIGWAGWKPQWPLIASFMFGGIILNLTLRSLYVFAAAKTLGENRRSGGLELLLTTPLQPQTITHGQQLALREQFRPLVLAILILNGTMFVTGLQSRSWQANPLIVYLLIWATLLGWTAMYLRAGRGIITPMWDGLVTGRPAYVALRISGIAQSPFWIAYMIFWISRSIGRAGLKVGDFPTGSLGEIFFCLIAVLIFIALTAVRRQRTNEIETRLLADFRKVAAQPVPEPSDPRFKNWKSGDPFPEN